MLRWGCFELFYRLERNLGDCSQPNELILEQLRGASNSNGSCATFFFTAMRGPGTTSHLAPPLVLILRRVYRSKPWQSRCPTGNNAYPALACDGNDDGSDDDGVVVDALESVTRVDLLMIVSMVAAVGEGRVRGDDGEIKRVNHCRLWMITCCFFYSAVATVFGKRHAS